LQALFLCFTYSSQDTEEAKIELGEEGERKGVCAEPSIRAD